MKFCQQLKRIECQQTNAKCITEYMLTLPRNKNKIITQHTNNSKTVPDEAQIHTYNAPNIRFDRKIKLMLLIYRLYSVFFAETESFSV